MFVSITRLTLRRFWLIGGFLRVSNGCILQARAAEECMAGATMYEWPLTFWTMTVWTSDRAMRQYMSSGAHGEAMPKLRGWCSFAATAHFNQSTVEIPEPKDAHRVLAAKAHFAPIAEPNPEHAAHEMPPLRFHVLNVFKSPDTRNLRPASGGAI